MAETMMEQQESSTLKKKHLLGVIYLALAMFAFVSVNALLKTVKQSYPIIEVVFFRYFFALIPCLIIFNLSGKKQVLKIKNLPVHCCRAALGVVSLCCLFQSVFLLPLAEATVFMFTASIFVTALAFPMLREKPSLLQWGAVALGFIGVLIVSRPTQNILNWGVLLGLTSAFLEAVVMVHNRKISTVNHPLTIVLYYLLFASAISACFLIFFWKTPSLHDFLIFLVLGLGGGIGQYLITLAYAYAPASLLSPVLYSSMLWSIGYGILFFQEIPDILLISGGALVILANLLVILNENRTRK